MDLNKAVEEFEREHGKKVPEEAKAMAKLMQHSVTRGKSEGYMNCLTDVMELMTKDESLMSSKTLYNFTLEKVQAVIGEQMQLQVDQLAVEAQLNALKATKTMVQSNGI